MGNKVFSTAVPMLKSLCSKALRRKVIKKVYESEHQQYGNEAPDNGFYKIVLPPIIFYWLI